MIIQQVRRQIPMHPLYFCIYVWHRLVAAQMLPDLVNVKDVQSGKNSWLLQQDAASGAIGRVVPDISYM